MKYEYFVTYLFAAVAAAASKSALAAEDDIM